MPSVCSSLAFLTEQKPESRRIDQSVFHIAARKSPMAVVGLPAISAARISLQKILNASVTLTFG